jgi:signal transduction histidine kinase
MASTISHDLRHPLTAILAYAEFLSEHDLSEDQRKDFLNEIRIAVNRMTDEVNSLLSFSKEREAVKPVLGPIDEVMARAIKTAKVLPEFESIDITFRHDDRAVAWCDTSKLERAMLNLLFNACDAVSPATGRIDVSCTATPRGMEVRVEDNGSGIPEPIVGSLFQPFVSYGKEKGIGLGLTIVQNIMQQHGGTVSVERTGKTGTVMCLTFPLPADLHSRTA